MRDREYSSRRSGRRVSRSRSRDDRRRERSRSRDRQQSRRDRSPRRSARRVSESPPPQRRRKEEEQPMIAAQTTKYSENPGSSTVWIGSIPEGLMDDELFDVFSKFGPIEGLKLVSNRGFGYVRYSQESEAKDALQYFASRSLFLGGKKCRIDSCEHMPQLGHPYKPSSALANKSSSSSCSTLFVGNLEMDVTEDELRKFFEPFTVVSVSLRRGGYKGMAFAHVRFDTSESCHKAADMYAGKRVRKNRIRLDWAVEKSMPSEAHGPVATSGPKVTEELRGTTPRIYVGGLNDLMIEEDLKHAFANFGNLVTVKLHKDKAGVRSFGYVTYDSCEAAERAVDASSQVSVKGQRVRVDFARQDRGPGMNGAAIPIAAVRISRSPSPQQPRVTPVSYQVPDGYHGMKSWEESYGAHSTASRSNGM